MEPTLKRKILNILSDYRWHSMAEMAHRCANGETIATSISQRIGEMRRRNIGFDERHFGSRHWEWKLLTKWESIDLKSCSLKPQQEPSAPLATVATSSKKSAAPPLLQTEITL